VNDEPTSELRDTELAPLPNRFTRDTLLGCVGIGCVLGMLGLFFLPLDVWHVPGWLALLVPLLALGVLALGAWLLMRVPAGSLPIARDPLRPLTGAGRAPVVERPATAANRLSAGLTLSLALTGAAAVGVIATGAFHRRALLPAILVTGLVGCALVGFGVLVGAGRVPPPAWRWVRMPLRGAARSAIPLGLAGFAALLWALLVAADAGYRWGVIGLGLLVVGFVLAAPLARRAPREDR
jgi:hypothetical protein